MVVSHRQAVARWLWVVPAATAGALVARAGPPEAHDLLWALVGTALVAAAVATQIRIRGFEASFSVEELVVVPAAVALGPTAAALMAMLGTLPRFRKGPRHRAGLNVALWAVAAATASYAARPLQTGDDPNPWASGTAAAVVTTLLFFLILLPSQLAAWVGADLGWSFTFAAVRAFIPWVPLVLLWGTVAPVVLRSPEGIAASALLIALFAGLYHALRTRSRADWARARRLAHVGAEIRDVMRSRDECVAKLHDGPLQVLLAGSFEIEVLTGPSGLLPTADAARVAHEARLALEEVEAEITNRPAAPAPGAPADPSRGDLAVDQARLVASGAAALAGTAALIGLSGLGTAGALAGVGLVLAVAGHQRLRGPADTPDLAAALVHGSLAAVAFVVTQLVLGTGAAIGLALVAVLVDLVHRRGTAPWLAPAVLGGAGALVAIAARAGAGFGAVAAGIPLAAWFAFLHTGRRDPQAERGDHEQLELVRKVLSARHRERDDLDDAVRSGLLPLIRQAVERLEEAAASGADVDVTDPAGGLTAAALAFRDLLNEGAGSVATAGLPAGLALLRRRMPDGVIATFDVDLPRRFGIVGTPEHLAAAVAYIVCREALDNAARHSRCTQVAVGVRAEEDAVLLRVADDGIGMAVDDRRPGFGLSLCERLLAEVGGSMQLSSAPAGGTAVVVRVPLERADGPAVVGR